MKLTPTQRNRGFTLVELLVTTAITITITGISVTGYLNVRNKAKMATEINGARNLIAAYLSHAADHNGAVMAGYRSDPDATNLNGTPLSYPMNARYPWRLAPDLPRMEGNMLFNGNESALNEDNSDYLASVMPNLGLNAVLVGGHYGSGSPLPPSSRLIEAYGNFHLTRLSQADSPEMLTVFASARSGKDRPGYFDVRPPRLTGAVWTSEKFSESSPASAHGFVDFRYNDKAVTASLAGNVQLLSENELRDMRRWSNQAAIEGDPDYTIKRQD